MITLFAHERVIFHISAYKRYAPFILTNIKSHRICVLEKGGGEGPTFQNVGASPLFSMMESTQIYFKRTSAETEATNKCWTFCCQYKMTSGASGKVATIRIWSNDPRFKSCYFHPFPHFFVLFYSSFHFTYSPHNYFPTPPPPPSTSSSSSSSFFSTNIFSYLSYLVIFIIVLFTKNNLLPFRS